MFDRINKKHLSQRLRVILTTTAVCVAVYCVLKYSKECSDGITKGLYFCVGVLIPSLFLFMVLSSYIANTRISVVFEKLMSMPTKWMFGLPKCCSGAILMSMIGGYPVGAGYVSSLYSIGKIDKSTAQKLALIAVCSGPGFVLNYIGNALLNNSYLGTILLVSQITGFVITGVIVGKTYRLSGDIRQVPMDNKTSTGSPLVKAVGDGCSATIRMCAMVIVFSAVISIFDKILYNYPVLCDIVSCVLEVTTACNRMCGRYSLTVISFIVGFGGICVHFQIFSALNKLEINKTIFFLIRIMQGIISAAATYILLVLFDDAIEVFYTTQEISKTESSVWGSATLLLVAVCFLGSLNYSQLKRR